MSSSPMIWSFLTFLKCKARTKNWAGIFNPCHTDLIDMLGGKPVFETLKVRFKNIPSTPCFISKVQPRNMETCFTGNQQAVTLFLLKHSCTSHIAKRYHVLQLQPNPTNAEMRTYVCTTLECQAEFVVTSYRNTCSNASNPDPTPKFSVNIIRPHDYNVSATLRRVYLTSKKGEWI